MNSIMICEGSTDYYLLQYYMREALGWTDDKLIQANILKLQGQKSRNLKKDDKILTIMASGGCSKLMEGFRGSLLRNFLTPPDMSEMFAKIIIVTDRDELDTESEFFKDVQDELNKFHASHMAEIHNNTWFTCSMRNKLGIEESFEVLLLVIPFEKNGAMETFLLDAIANDNPYDNQIIQSCNQFVDNVDPQRQYLKSRRYITKAKFDTYFSIRTPAEQFVERQKILKDVKWEQYASIQTDFNRLSEI